MEDKPNKFDLGSIVSYYGVKGKIIEWEKTKKGVFYTIDLGYTVKRINELELESV